MVAQGPLLRPCGFSSGVGSCRAANKNNPNSHAPRRQTRVAVEEPPTIKIGGLEGERCATSLGVDAAEQQARCGLAIDRVRLPADEKARIWN